MTVTGWNAEIRSRYLKTLMTGDQIRGRRAVFLTSSSQDRTALRRKRLLRDEQHSAALLMRTVRDKHCCLPPPAKRARVCACACACACACVGVWVWVCVWRGWSAPRKVATVRGARGLPRPARCYPQGVPSLMMRFSGFANPHTSWVS